MTPAEIARSLTKSQREALLKGATRAADGSIIVVARSFVDDKPWPPKLVQYKSRYLDSLTPLGLAVRALMEARDGE